MSDQENEPIEDYEVGEPPLPGSQDEFDTGRDFSSDRVDYVPMLADYGPARTVNFPYSSDPASPFTEGYHPKAQGPQDTEVQKYGVLGKYKAQDEGFGWSNRVLGTENDLVRETIYGVEPTERTPQIVDPDAKGRQIVLQGVGRQVHCTYCDRDVNASQYDPTTERCAYGTKAYEDCRPAGIEND